MKISEKYGPVFTVHLGFRKVVVLTGYEAVKDALLNTADVTYLGLAFPPHPSPPKQAPAGCKIVVLVVVLRNSHTTSANEPCDPFVGVFFSSQELWRKTRRFTMTAMRDLGMGKRLAEERIIEELQFLIGLIKSFKGGPFQLRCLNTAPTNITFAILFGRRFDYEDPTFVTLLRLIDEVMLLLGSPFLHLFNFYPFLGFLLKPHKIILKKIEEVCVILKKHIKESKENINGNNLTSYIDALVFKQEEKNKDSPFHDENVLASALDLLMAGTETTSTTLQWAVLLMMKYPEIQKKVHAEIERVLGPDCLPTFEDRKKMPFTTAVIHEVQRFVTLLPHVPRCTSTDTHFKGYFIPKVLAALRTKSRVVHMHHTSDPQGKIPKGEVWLCGCTGEALKQNVVVLQGTTVIPLLTSVLLDKTQWETPDEFNPNHFLDSEGNFVKKKAFLPFSTGRRNCIGESLATVELFIFFTGLIQKFTFKPPSGVKESELDTTAEAGFTMRPRPQCACAVLRS
ncbi:Cytochrome P450 2W1-like isoform X1 [Aix galericulata]|nr:Cytochrome P450 2W1-like isoform X1 [Aix galericulata]